MLRDVCPAPVVGRVGRVASLAIVAASLSAATGACGGDGGSDAERFCGEIAADPAAVVAPAITDDAQFDATLAHYRMLADLAPVAIETEWRDLVLNLETANTVEVDDPDSIQRAVAQAYASERSAVAVSEWLLVNCSIDLGPVTTITPQGPVVPPVDDSEEFDEVPAG